MKLDGVVAMCQIVWNHECSVEDTVDSTTSVQTNIFLFSFLSISIVHSQAHLYKGSFDKCVHVRYVEIILLKSQ